MYFFIVKSFFWHKKLYVYVINYYRRQRGKCNLFSKKSTVLRQEVY